MGKVLGLGGVFFKAKDPDTLKQWYIDHLGVPATEEPGISFPNSDQPADGYSVLGPFKADTSYFDPSRREFMINLVVDDIHAVLARARSGGATIVGEVEEYEFGQFGWIIDPDGNKIELWQPPAA